jgi:hypothetical protein
VSRFPPMCCSHLTWRSTPPVVRRSVMGVTDEMEADIARPFGGGDRGCQFCRAGTDIMFGAGRPATAVSGHGADSIPIESSSVVRPTGVRQCPAEPS